MTIQHTLFVCTTCASTWKDGKRVGESGGEKFLAQLSQLQKNWQLEREFPIKPVSCMSSCSSPCSVSFAAPRKHVYLFGNLEPEEATAEAVLECAGQYYSQPEGMLSWNQRPQQLKNGVIARIPPFSQS